MYVKHISADRFRCFESMSADLVVPGDEGGLQGATVIVGPNGAGKSSILRAIALTCLSGVIEKSGLVVRDQIRLGARPRQARLGATISLSHQDAGAVEAGQRVTEQTATRISRRGDIEVIETDERAVFWEGLYEERGVSFFVLAYGATRRVDLSEQFDPQVLLKQRRLRYQRVAGLFEDHLALVPLTAWLPKTDRNRRSEVLQILGRLLPDELRCDFSEEDESLVYRLHGAAIPFDALSDGYRIFAGMAGDLLYRLHEASDQDRRWALDELEGIVLIDEVDLHLHPSWQRVVVGLLTRGLPRLQFIMTSHSPLVVGSVRARQILDLEPDEPAIEAMASDAAPSDAAGSAPWPAYHAVVRPDARVHGLSADQILTSDYFDLDTTRSEASVSERRRLMLRAAKGDEDAARAFAELLVEGVPE